ncbi:MAG: amidase domain-containing protein [Acidimicrobiales bacterium]
MAVKRLIPVTMVLVAAMAGLGLAAPGGAKAYNGTTAASYADQHWKECDSRFGNIQPPSPYVCVQNNCTNFASRVMAAGGNPQVIDSGGPDNWYYWNSAVYSNSWVLVPSLYFFLLIYERDAGHPGGTVRADFVGVTASQQYDALLKGDLIFMDYGNNGSLDHMRVEAGCGDPGYRGYDAAYGGAYGAVGDWADQQTYSRYHDFWNGYYQMDATTAKYVRIIEVHVNS